MEYATTPDPGERVELCTRCKGFAIKTVRKGFSQFCPDCKGTARRDIQESTCASRIFFTMANIACYCFETKAAEIGLQGWIPNPEKLWRKILANCQVELGKALPFETVLKIREECKKKNNYTRSFIKKQVLIHGNKVPKMFSKNGVMYSNVLEDIKKIEDERFLKACDEAIEELASNITVGRATPKSTEFSKVLFNQDGARTGRISMGCKTPKPNCDICTNHCEPNQNRDVFCNPELGVTYQEPILDDPLKKISALCEEFVYKEINWKGTRYWTSYHASSWEAYIYFKERETGKIARGNALLLEEEDKGMVYRLRLFTPDGTVRYDLKQSLDGCINIAKALLKPFLEKYKE